jgi:hypothetical protein
MLMEMRAVMLRKCQHGPDIPGLIMTRNLGVPSA